MLRPYPTAPLRKQSRTRGRKKGKCSTITDTLEKDELMKAEEERNNKSKKKGAKAKIITTAKKKHCSSDSDTDGNISLRDESPPPRDLKEYFSQIEQELDPSDVEEKKDSEEDNSTCVACSGEYRLSKEEFIQCLLCNQWAHKSYVVEVTTRWRTLRERYTKEMRLHDYQTQSGNGQEDAADLQWEWYEAMGFLFSHVKSRKTTGSLVTTREESWGSEVIEYETVESIPSTTSASSRLDEDKVPTPTNNRKRRLGGDSGGSTPRRNKRYEDIDHEVLKTLKDMESHRQEDEDDHFGKVMAAELRKIEDPRTKQIRKARIYMVATGIEF
ncbi:hypothetical protein RN001_003619 [Aquatica leii]|uniref:MADF domain-containing protein n=1 Tax=Aquatica leii TaxID=1421715 RepID=A0AAN7PIU1_9COLE|nr:hypothetical protein RN001_003619 [Aquatica leii]